MIDTILLGVIAAGVAAHVALVARPSSAPAKSAPQAPSRAPEAPPAAPTENDLRIEGLIQAVDPSWALGDDRDHVALIPDGNGQIVEARLR